jgi:hypothetical protein
MEIVHDDEYVRSYAAWALGHLQVEEAVPLLEARLRVLDFTRGSREAHVVGVAVARLNTARRSSEEDGRPPSLRLRTILRCRPRTSSQRRGASASTRT